MITFIDCSTPLKTYPQADGIAFYIGGDTPHVWTPSEIAQTPYRFRLPIFVRSNPGDPGVSVANDVLNALNYLKSIKAPAGCLIALDLETAVNPPYVSNFYVGMKQAGFAVMDYGSKSTLYGNNNPSGYYWGADWTGVKHITPEDNMTQWANEGGYDISAAELGLPFWDTWPQPPAPVPPTPLPLTPFPGNWKTFIGAYYNGNTGKIGIVGIGTDGQIYEVMEIGPVGFGQWGVPTAIAGKVTMS
jgi:hypothetical protein